MYDKYAVLGYIRDEMLSDPFVSDELVYRAFDKACINGDIEALFERYMLHTSQEERRMCLRSIEDLLKQFGEW